MRLSQMNNSFMQAASTFQINPRVNSEAFSTNFRRTSRAQVADVLLPEAADHLYRALQLLRWRPHVRVAASGECFASCEPPTAPGRDFACTYETAAHEPGASGLDQFVEFLNSHSFIDFVEAVSGVSGFQRVSCQVTCFRPGHFLNFHTDGYGTKSIAYAFNLNPGWKPDWGGILHFADDRRTICDSFVPRFNTLSLFAVPQLHCVSAIAPHAPAARYAISGWLYRDPSGTTPGRAAPERFKAHP
jgi:hypothetical protein